MLKGAVIGIDDEDDSTFTITADQNRSYYFQGNLCNTTTTTTTTITVLRLSGFCPGLLGEQERKEQKPIWISCSKRQ